MNILHSLRVLRKRWRMISLFALIGTTLAATYTALATPEYVAHSQMFIAAKDPNPDQAYYSNLFSSQRVASYVLLVGAEPVLQPVVADLKLPFTWQALAGKVSASNPAGTVFLDISVRDTSAARAQEINVAIDASFASYVAKIETVHSSQAPVKATVVQPAVRPGSPSSPRTLVDLIAGVLLGLAIGAIAALIRDVLDTSIKDPNEIQRRFNAPSLGVIPFDGDAPKHPLVFGDAVRSPRGEAFRQLRTNLQFLQIDQQPRSILVTSSVAEEGKTTTACNIAAVLAQSGVNVILLEGDLRRPRVGPYLGLEPAVGLTSVLLDAALLDTALQTWGPVDATMRVLTSGPLPPNPSELLGSPQMARLLQRLEGLSDVVIIDGPPLLPVADSSILAAAASGTVLVVRHDKTRAPQVNRAIEILRSVDASLFGVVLNMTRSRPGDAYYGYGYGYGYNDPIPGVGEPLATSGGRGAHPGE